MVAVLQQLEVRESLNDSPIEALKFGEIQVFRTLQDTNNWHLQQGSLEVSELYVVVWNLGRWRGGRRQMLPSLASFVSLLQICWSECRHSTATTLIPEMEVEVATRNFDRRNGTTQAAAECHVLQRKHSGAHKATFSLVEFRSADAAKKLPASCFYSFIAVSQGC